MYKELLQNNESIDENNFDGEDQDIFDSMVELITSVLGFPMGGICLVKDETLSLVGQFGLKGTDNFCREETLCHFTLLQDSCLEVSDALSDPRFRESKYVTGEPFISSYAGIPLIVKSLGKVGTLFVADYSPRDFSHEEINTLRAFSKQVQSILTDKMIKSILLKKEAKYIENLKYFVHDLKNPMTIVKSSLDLMRGRDQGRVENHGRLISRCKNNLMRVFMTLDELLNSEQIKEVGGTREYEKFDLKDLVFDCTKNMQFLIPGNQQIFLKTSSVIIQTNEELLKRIIENLLSNSIKYGQESNITIEFSILNTMVEVHISDQGPGIRDELKERIFEFGFKKGHSFFASHGIGLHFCRQAARELGGDVTLTDNEPQGTTFIIKLPLKN